ncbi:MAG: VCBS repeat-containing protein [Planctomycetota bacterium]
MSRHLVTLVALISLSTLAAIPTLAADAPKIRFAKTQLDPKFRSEGVAVGDFNKDGKMDIAAGFVWYEAPDWTMHTIVTEPPSAGRNAELGTPLHFEPKSYSNSFCNFAEDVNGDGWTDLIVVDFPGTPTWWFENPQGKGGEWKKHLCTPVTNNESPDFLDLDGDGKRELIAGFSPDAAQPDGPDRQMAYITRDEDPYKPWHIHPVSEKGTPGTKRYSHGLGVGDVNGDGRNDILCADGWWEAPQSPSEDLWVFHEVQFGERAGEGKAAQMFAYDFDGDGDNDVLSSSPHGFGIWWHEQFPGGNWKTHEIDKSFSQTHAVCLADINGDGLMDFVTGKRWWAHASGDPGGDQPAVFYWFELTCEDGRPQWIRHQLDHDSGPGTQFQVADVNGDGLLDIIASNKKGVHYFQQVRD